MSKLGTIQKRGAETYAPGALAARATQAPSSTRLGAVLKQGPRGETLEVPVLGLVRIELPGCRADQEIEAATLAAIQDLKLDGGSPSRAAMRYELERATRTLAVAVRDPDNRENALGTLDEWRAVDPDTIAVLWAIYGEMRERLDVAPPAAINEVEDQMITAARGRGDIGALVSYGAVKLAAYAVAHADELLAATAAVKEADAS